jgi:hypothetical protein
MYTAAYNEKTPNIASTVDSGKSSKIDKICDKIRQALERINPDKYVNNIDFKIISSWNRILNNF